MPETRTEAETGPRPTLDIAQAVHRYGRHFVPALCPEDIRRDEVGRCFDTCALNVLYASKYRYVEGIAQNPVTKEWLYHAWLTDGVHAFDPTWRAYSRGTEVPVPSTYVGFEIPRELIIDFIRQTEYNSLILNWKRAPEIARRAVPVIDLLKI